MLQLALRLPTTSSNSTCSITIKHFICLSRHPPSSLEAIWRKPNCVMLRAHTTQIRGFRSASRSEGEGVQVQISVCLGRLLTLLGRYG